MLEAWAIVAAAAATALRSTHSNSSPSPGDGVASFPSRFFIRVTTWETVRMASRRNSGSSKFLSAFRLKSDSEDTLFLMSWMTNDVSRWNASNSRARPTFSESWAMARIPAACSPTVARNSRSS